MAKQTDNRPFRKASEQISSTGVPGVVKLDKHTDQTLAGRPDDVTNLNIIEMAGLLEDPRSHDDFKSQIRQFLETKLGRPVNQRRPEFG